MNILEAQLLVKLADMGQFRNDNAITIGERMGVPPKRVAYWLDKWTDKGLWNYGVSARSGWVTDKGKEKVVELKARGLV